MKKEICCFCRKGFLRKQKKIIRYNLKGKSINLKQKVLYCNFCKEIILETDHLESEIFKILVKGV